MATYNGELFIKEQVSSILSQLGSKDELIISDDFSSDNTIPIIKNFKDHRILLLENTHHLGVVKNFEKALMVAKGDYIFLSDQDDVWLPGKVETLVKHLKENAAVQSDAYIVNSKLEIIGPSYFELTNAKTGLVSNLFKNHYMGCSMALDKKVLRIGLPFPDKIPMHDLWLGFVSELFFNTCFIDEKLLLYRRHSSNVSQTVTVSLFGLFQKFAFRLNLIRYLPLLIKRRYFKRQLKQQ